MTWYFVFLYWSGYWNQTQTMGLLQLISVSHSVVRVSFVSLCHWNILAFCTLFLLFISLLTSFWVHNREFLSPLATDVTSISVNLQKQTIYCDIEWVMFTADYISRSLKKNYFRNVVCLESLLLCQFILDVV